MKHASQLGPLHKVPSNPAKKVDARNARGDTSSKPPQPSREEKKRVDAEARKKERAIQARRARIEDLEARIANAEQAIRDLEQTMATPGFYDDRAAAQPMIDKHQALMWEVGSLMGQWEELHSLSDVTSQTDR